MDDELPRLKGYLLRIGQFIKDDALNARRECENADADRMEFARGKLWAYWEVVTTLQMYAEPNGISLQGLQLHDVNSGKELLPYALRDAK